MSDTDRRRASHSSLLEISKWIGDEGKDYVAARMAPEIAKDCSKALGYEVSPFTLKVPLNFHEFKTRIQVSKELAEGGGGCVRPGPGLLPVFFRFPERTPLSYQPHPNGGPTTTTTQTPPKQERIWSTAPPRGPQSHPTSQRKTPP